MSTIKKSVNEVQIQLCSPPLLTPSSINVAKERIVNLLHKDFMLTDNIGKKDFSSYLSEEAYIDPEIKRFIINELLLSDCFFLPKESTKISNLIESLSSSTKKSTLSLRNPWYSSSSASSAATTTRTAALATTENDASSSTDSCVIEYCLIRINEIAFTGSFIDRHMEYNISVSSSLNILDQFNPSFPFEIISNVVRRFSDLFFLHEMLSIKYPFRFVPNLPRKAYLLPINMKQRRQGMENFLFIISNHPILRADSLVRTFFIEKNFQLSKRRSNESCVENTNNIHIHGDDDHHHHHDDHHDHPRFLMRESEKFIQESIKIFSQIRKSIFSFKSSYERFVYSISDGGASSQSLSSSLRGLDFILDTKEYCLQNLPSDLCKMEEIIIKYCKVDLLDLVRNIDYLLLLLKAASLTTNRVKGTFFCDFDGIENEILLRNTELEGLRIKARIVPPPLTQTPPQQTPPQHGKNKYETSISALEIKILGLQKSLLLNSKQNTLKQNHLAIEIEWLKGEIRKSIPLINYIIRVRLGNSFNELCDLF